MSADPVLELTRLMNAALCVTGEGCTCGAPVSTPAGMHHCDCPVHPGWCGRTGCLPCEESGHAEPVRELTPEQMGRLGRALGVLLARVICLERHQQTNNGRCSNCISVAKALVPRHIDGLAGVVAVMLAES
jgi:hypothetical protein